MFATWDMPVLTAGQLDCPNNLGIHVMDAPFFSQGYSFMFI